MGAFAPILDLNVLKTFLWVQKVCMKSIWSVSAYLLPRDFLASVDIKDAYLHVTIFPCNKFFLHFVTSARFN